MMDELILAVVREAGLSPEQAALAVTTVVNFLTARLPSPLVGELRERLGALPGNVGGTPRSASRPPGSA